MKKLLLILVIVFLSSCGYEVRRAPFASVAIGDIENRTFEHGLEDGLRVALAGEFMKSGIRIDGSSQYRIKGVIDAFEMRMTAERGGIAVGWEVRIGGRVVLEGPEGTETLKQGSLNPYPVSFSTEGTIEDLMALKEKAIGKAMGDIAADVVSSVMAR